MRRQRTDLSKATEGCSLSEGSALVKKHRNVGHSQPLHGVEHHLQTELGKICALEWSHLAHLSGWESETIYKLPQNVDIDGLPLEKTYITLEPFGLSLFGLGRFFMCDDIHAVNAPLWLCGPDIITFRLGIDWLVQIVIGVGRDMLPSEKLKNFWVEANLHSIRGAIEQQNKTQIDVTQREPNAQEEIT
ncbi:hypothetical protein VNO78_32439 [Psophocarpus tetragonolobus]|uniref:Uncharacterized protein n=1 Tax=Psophocarpus tetragonolobus TaxID=3891 RepID=A0AAN9P0V7_PSOTE